MSGHCHLCLQLTRNRVGSFAFIFENSGFLEIQGKDTLSSFRFDGFRSLVVPLDLLLNSGLLLMRGHGGCGCRPTISGDSHFPCSPRPSGMICTPHVFFTMPTEMPSHAPSIPDAYPPSRLDGSSTSASSATSHGSRGMTPMAS